MEFLSLKEQLYGKNTAPVRGEASRPKGDNVFGNPEVKVMFKDIEKAFRSSQYSQASRTFSSESPSCFAIAFSVISRPCSAYILGVCEVNLAKHRSGPTETFDLTWVARYTKFSDKA